MLRSQLFRGDRRLGRCAVNNADHVTPGTTGDFVSKIQEALVILDDAILTGTEISDRRYYLLFNRQNEDPQIVQGIPRSHNRADFADTWAKYVNAVTGQPEDR